MIDIEKIKIDSKAQARTRLCKATIAEYAEGYKNGATFPPITLYFDGQNYWLADGFHRYFGAQTAGKKQILEEITPGTLRDAVLHSLGANAIHGLPRSNADKRKAIRTLLDDPEWTALSSREIARICNVSHPLVLDERNRPLVILPPKDEEKPDSAGDQNDAKQPAKPANTDNLGGDQDADYDANECTDEEPEYTELDQAHDQIAELQNALSVAAQGELGEEEKAEALSLVDGLRAEIKTLEASLRAMTISRDNFQNQVAQLKKQCEMQRKELSRLKAAA